MFVPHSHPSRSHCLILGTDVLWIIDPTSAGRLWRAFLLSLIIGAIWHTIFFYSYAPVSAHSFVLSLVPTVYVLCSMWGVYIFCAPLHFGAFHCFVNCFIVCLFLLSCTTILIFFFNKLRLNII